MTDEDKIVALERKLANAESEMNGWKKNKNGAANAAMAKNLVDALHAELESLKRSRLACQSSKPSS